jgi:hypothetical protein
MFQRKDEQVYLNVPILLLSDSSLALSRSLTMHPFDAFSPSSILLVIDH